MRLKATLAASLLASSVVWGSWQVMDAGGIPSDVDIADAGAPEWFGVSTSTGAYSFRSDAGLVGSVTTQASVAVLFDQGKGCIALVPQNCLLSWQSTCSATNGTGPSFATTCLRGRQSGSAGFLVTTYSGSPFPSLYYSKTAGASSANDWYYGTSGSSANAQSAALGALAGASMSYGLFAGHDFFKGSSLYLCAADAGISTIPCNPPMSSSPVGPPVTDLELLGIGGPQSVLVAWGVPGDAGVTQFFFSDGGSTPISLPGVVRIGGLSFEQGTGDAFGDGFGMLAVQNADGGQGVLSAVPDPNNPAVTWVPSTHPPSGYAGDLGHLRCLAGHFCVIVTDGGNTSNVVLYRNDFPPDASQVQSTVDLAVGALNQTTFVVDDPDGDAVFLTWQGPDGGYPFAFTALPPQNLTIQIDAGVGGACGSGPQPFTFNVVASDGYAPHDQSAQVTFLLPSGGTLPGPDIPDGGLLVLRAGSAPLQVTLSQPLDSGCPLPTGYVVTPVSNPDSVNVTIGGGLLVTVPATYCNASPGLDTFQVASQDGGSSPLEIEVLPWGLPNDPLAPLFQLAFQDAGSTVAYARQPQVHACQDAGGFPGVLTSWSWGDAGVTVVGQDGGATSPITSPSIDVTLPECTPSSVTLTVVNTTNDGSDAGSNAGTLTVKSNLIVFPPLSADTLNVSADAGNGIIQAQASIVPVPPCPTQRGLQILFSLDGGQQIDAGVDDTGQASATLTLSSLICAAGTYVVIGQVFEDGGLTGLSGSATVSVPTLPTPVPILAAQPPVAQCGQTATAGSIQATYVVDGGPVCTNLTWSWTQTAGPALIGLDANSQSVTLQPEETGFGLIGQTVSVMATDQGNPGNVAQRSIDVRIKAPHFVTVVHRTDAAQPQENGLVGVAVTLTNTTACGVAGLEYDERPDGLNAVAGTGRVVGRPVDVGGDPSQLRFSGIALPAYGSVTLTYSARLHLLTPFAPHGQAFLSQQDVSDDAGLPAQPSGCGCASASDLGAAFALLACVRAFRRRRFRSRVRRPAPSRRGRYHHPGEPAEPGHEQPVCVAGARRNSDLRIRLPEPTHFQRRVRDIDVQRLQPQRRAARRI